MRVSAATGCCPETATKLPAGGHENCPLMVMGSARHDVVCLAASAVEAPSSGALAVLKRPRSRGRDTVKSAGEIMEILKRST